MTAARAKRSPAPPARSKRRVADPFGFDDGFFRRYLEPLLEFFYTKWFRVEVSGLENIPAEGRALIVANHAGPLPFDAPMILHAIRRDHPAHRHVRYLVLKWLCATPFAAPLIQRLGFVLACRENARALLERDQLVGVFPEGIKGTAKLYRNRYKLVRFGRGGFAEMALETESPIIPTAVVGGEETHPTLAHAYPLARLLGLPYFPITPQFPLLGLAGVMPLPAKFYIHFGKPIRLRRGSARKATDFHSVHALSTLVRDEIQKDVQRLVERRPSVFWGAP